MNMLFAVGLFFGLTTSAPVAQSRDSLELQIKPEQVEDGMPQAFTFLLINRGDHDLRVPTPIVNCGSGYTGSVSLQVHFVPLTPGDALPGRGCAADKYRWPPILERVKEWKVLHPGESLTIADDKTQPFLTNPIPGNYEFWAVYEPPSTTAEDQDKLTAAGIDFPHGKLVSEHVVFVRKHP